MHTLRFWLFSTVLFLGLGCGTSKKATTTTAVTTTIPEVTVEETDLDTLTISAPRVIPEMKAEDYSLPPYNPSYTLKNDLQHTKLDLRFNWDQQTVIGKAELKLKPVFYPVKTLELDAQNFVINSISIGKNKKALQYDYDNKILTIQLDREYKSSEEYQINIDYTAHPTTGEAGGSAAITSEQGLFFVNHDGSDKDKPMQIWTQGETEYNSRWFPTIDKPIERTTQEIYLTVQERFNTLSNGMMVSSKSNGDGTRTDYWKMDLPHAPYLFMLAVGEFAVVKDTWNGISVEYYVEPEFKKDARAIFAHTPEMLDFFSKLLDVPYPWPKYSQIVVRDFVSGAMENTTGSIFGDFVQRTSRELIDDNNDRIVAHELFHHWFGDMVTCESWANLTLNEGFANYSEYLWEEHKRGREAADYLLQGDQNGYIQSTGYSGVHPLIHFAYDDKEDMFDAHSYNKGGAVLHMLRTYLGDEAFFAGLKKYLVDNAYSAVETHELRMAFEDVCGEDLNWFFNQWYFNAGHPVLDISYDYDEVKKKVAVTIEQQQDVETSPAIFVLPMGIDVYLGKRAPIHHEIKITKRKQTFTFDASEKPKLVNVDTDKGTLAVVNDNKTIDEFTFQYYNGKNYRDRWEALEALSGSELPSAQKVFETALKDSFWGLREMAIEELEGNTDIAVVQTITQLAENDPRSDVRSSALLFLGSTGDVQHSDLLQKAIKKDPTYTGMAAALSALVAVDSLKALDIAKSLEKEDNPGVIGSLVEVFTQVPDVNNLAYFEKNVNKLDAYSALSLFDGYLATVKLIDDESQAQKSLDFLIDNGNNNDSPWRRFGATRAIYAWSSHYEKSGDTASAERLMKVVRSIIAAETDPQLGSIYSQLK